MKTQILDNNCKVLLIHGLGTVHWDRTYDSIKKFKKKLNKHIRKESENLSKYIDPQQKHYIAITHQPSQPNETQWLKELGFKQLEMGDGLILSSMDYFTWSGKR